MKEVSAPELSRRKSELYGLTGLRFFAAFYVVTYHYFQPAFGDAPVAIGNIAAVGYVAVGIFFLLSGFILSYSYVGRDGQFRGSARMFWVARLARIYPAYLAGFVLATPFVVLGSLHANTLATAAVKLGCNGVLALLLQQSWTPWTAWYWNTPGWSLSTEVFFYACFPLLASFAGRLRREQIVLALPLVWAASVAAPILVSAMTPIAAQPPIPPLQLAVEVMPVLRLPEFVLGVLLGRLYVLNGAHRYGGGWLALAGAVSILLILSISSVFPRPFLSNGLLAWATGLLLYGLAQGGGALGAFLSHKWIVRLGEASYSVYILQWPVAHAFGIASGTSSLLVFSIYSVVLIALSFVCLHMLETPARKRIVRRFGETKPEQISAPEAVNVSVANVAAQVI